ncbi:HAD-IA family hydrolase [Marinobacterium arenosum]|uniref:HAD-IA family hydrolase n=1 Tax=Marinobacterium arenosum TaxID=2862496 RepID=UPI001C9738D2|nr:HAD-IA family hydrolase [Marinobacterium arenosum]MBY4676010.1 HAD-IA family hydrolase [Marinobacterium arenosum]
MQPTLEAVLFDLDGTLIDTAPDFHWVINRLLEEEGRPPVEFPFLRSQVSNGARAMVCAAFEIDIDHPDFSDLLQRMLRLYQQHLAVDSALFPGLESLLDRLEQHAIPWGIVTNKPALYAEPMLRGLNLAERSATLICPEHVNQRKPHPESLFTACRQIDRQPQHCVYVGDHIRDIEAGRRAGMRTVAAGYGYIDSDDNIELWQADHCIQRADQLLPLLQSLYSFDDR